MKLSEKKMVLYRSLASTYKLYLLIDENIAE